MDSELANQITGQLSGQMAEQFTLANIFAWIVFGIAGWYVFKHGKNNGNIKHIGLGLALMVYPYFVSRALFNWLVGLVLMAAVYVTR